MLSINLRDHVHIAIGKHARAGIDKISTLRLKTELTVWISGSHTGGMFRKLNAQSFVQLPRIDARVEKKDINRTMVKEGENNQAIIWDCS